MSVERYHCYVQYSTLISCRECQKISLLCTVQYIDFMSWVSKDALILLFGIAGSSERFPSGNMLGIGGCYGIEKIKDSIQ